LPPDEPLELDEPDEGEGEGDPLDELVVDPLEPEVESLDFDGAGVFDAEVVHGVASGWIACGPIPSSPPGAPAPAGIPELPPGVGAPLEDVPAELPPEEPPVVPPLGSEHPLPLWLPPESEPEHAAVAAERATTANARESESFIRKTPLFGVARSDRVNVFESGPVAHSGSEMRRSPAHFSRVARPAGRRVRATRNRT
jgi:hypothetical protein